VNVCGCVCVFVCVCVCVCVRGGGGGVAVIFCTECLHTEMILIDIGTKWFSGAMRSIGSCTVQCASLQSMHVTIPVGLTNSTCSLHPNKLMGECG